MIFHSLLGKLTPVKHRFAAGFTLLEVLIALAILAISASAIIGQSGQSLSQLQQLQLKSTAMIVAENQMSALYIAEQWPGLGSISDTVTIADRPWFITTTISATTDPWLRKVEIAVREEEGRDVPVLVTLTSYRGRY